MQRRPSTKPPPQVNRDITAWPPRDFCNPPYDVNDDGIRIYKRACL
jgi:hypothetical protein